MVFNTERLVLRPWEESDAESLYEYAKDSDVGPIAGWPIHTSVEDSREIIKTVLAVDETYAICKREDNRAIGSIGLMRGKQSNLDIPEDEGELGFWIGVPFWGHGNCKCGVQYEFESEVKWHCGCCGAPFKIHPVEKDISYYLKLVESGGR